MALVFYKSPEEPAQCAFEISRALKEHPSSANPNGHSQRSVSGCGGRNRATNVAGAGINIARRVMDCGDVGHHPFSRHVAEDLAEYERWRPSCTISAPSSKARVHVSVTNLYIG